MGGPAKNKELITRFLEEMNGIRKERQHLEQFVSDERLIAHILFFEQVFPAHALLLDEATADGDRVICRVRLKGRHVGRLAGAPPTRKLVDFPMVLGCTIEKNKIANHWLIADQIQLLEQLGIEHENKQL